MLKRRLRDSRLRMRQKNKIRKKIMWNNKQMRKWKK